MQPQLLPGLGLHKPWRPVWRPADRKAGADGGDLLTMLPWQLTGAYCYLTHSPASTPAH